MHQMQVSANQPYQSATDLVPQYRKFLAIDRIVAQAMLL